MPPKVTPKPPTTHGHLAREATAPASGVTALPVSAPRVTSSAFSSTPTFQLRFHHGALSGISASVGASAEFRATGTASSATLALCAGTLCVTRASLTAPRFHGEFSGKSANVGDSALGRIAVSVVTFGGDVSCLPNNDS